jgi:hypothetical protein
LAETLRRAAAEFSLTRAASAPDLRGIKSHEAMRFSVHTYRVAVDDLNAPDADRLGRKGKR